MYATNYSCYDTAQYLPLATELATPWGKVGSIVETDEPLQFQVMAAFSKSLSFHWEFMMTRPTTGVGMESQSRILKQVAKLIDAGILSGIVTQTSKFTLENVKRGHETIESGKAIGKIVFEVGDDVE